MGDFTSFFVNPSVDTFGGMLASKGFTYGLTGLASGYSTGSKIAEARYNAAAARQQADAIVSQSNLSAYLFRQQFAYEYRKMQNDQSQQMSMNRVLQMKHGITGRSADVTMMSYAAKGQENLNMLYYNAAMETGKNSIAASVARNQMLAKAQQYEIQATREGIAGVLGFGSSLLGEERRLNKPTTDITGGLTNMSAVFAANRNNSTGLGYESFGL